MASDSKVVSVSVSANEYNLLKTQDAYRIEMNGFHSIMDPGKPLLPMKNILVALPPGAKVLSVDVVSQESHDLPGSYLIEPAPPIIPLDDSSVRPDLFEQMQEEWFRNYRTVYSQDQPYPESTGRLVSTGSLRKYRYAQVSYCPFKYFPRSGRLVHFPDCQINIHCEVPVQDSPEYKELEEMNRDTLADARARELFCNYSEMKLRYEYRGSYRGSFPESSNLVIITIDELADAVISSDFIPWKESLGYSVRLMRVTDPEIAMQPGRDLAEQIRNFLRENYIDWGIEYVLLVGDSEQVPMRYFYPNLWMHSKNPSDPMNPGTAIPSDYYYADLSDPESTNWDSDGDGYPGEYGQDTPDFLAEVFVGRIPASTPNDTTYTLAKLVRVEQDTGSWKDSALHAGTMMFFAQQDHNPWPQDEDGATLMTHIETDIMDGWTISHYSEQEGLSPSAYDWPAITETAFSGDWLNGQYGVVNWAGHGFPSCASRTIWAEDDGDEIPESEELQGIRFIGIGEASHLDDDYPSIVFSVACSVGYPEPNWAGNFGVELLTEQVRGSAIAVLAATRGACIVGEWPSNQGGAESLCYDFNRYLINGPNGPETLGEALYNSKFHVNHNYPMQHMFEYQNMYIYNLYGDPTYRREGATPLPSPTPLPTCETFGVTLDLPSDVFHAGDLFECSITICNPTDEMYPSIPLFVVLEVGGHFFWAPGFTDFDCFNVDLTPGQWLMPVITPFPWPASAGTGNATWLAALTDPAMTVLLGKVDFYPFSWE